MGWRHSTEAQLQDKAVRYAMEGSAHEFVAVIIGNYWIELDNIGNADDGAFEVDDASVRGALEWAHEKGLGLSCVLWHSHPFSYGPSLHDVEHFPDWCWAGLIFHAPTQRTLAYDMHGVMVSNPYSNKAVSDSALATVDNG